MSNNISATTAAFLSGSIGGATSTLVGLPFDFVKTNAQMSRQGSLSTLRTVMIQDRNVLNFYRGSTPAVLSAVTENGVVFGANSVIKRLFESVAARTPGNWEVAVLGGFAGIFSATAISPFETLKVRQQTERLRAQPSASSSRATTTTTSALLRRIVQTEGSAALFRGLPAQLARDIPFNFVFFGSYELFCHRLEAMQGAANRDALSVSSLVMAGGMAGVAGWFVTLPADIIKTRMNAAAFNKNASAIETAKRVMVDIYTKENGLRGFWRGFTAVAVRSFPVNGTLFASYSLSEKMFR